MQLDEKFSVNTDGAGTILLFQEQRKREKNGVEVDFTFKDQWFYLNIQQALNKYLDLKIEGAKDVEECIKKIEEVRTIIKSINGSI
jgi:hypothetical protein